MRALTEANDELAANDGYFSLCSRHIHSQVACVCVCVCECAVRPRELLLLFFHKIDREIDREIASEQRLYESLRLSSCKSVCAANLPLVPLVGPPIMSQWA